MKGVSTIIATILMLVIVISMSAFAFTYMTGIFTTTTAVVLNVDDTSYCSGTTGTTIYVMIDSSGTSTVDANKVRISGINANGVNIAEQPCSATSVTINASSVYQCTNTLVGTAGFNTVKVKDPSGRSHSAVVQCIG